MSTTQTIESPIDEAAALYLDAHPEVRNLIPAWAEDVEHMWDDSVSWSYSISRGEIEVAGCVMVDDDGSARREDPTVILPTDSAGWHDMGQAGLIARLRALAADLTEIADRLES